MTVNAVRLNHAVLFVADLKRSIAFYSQAFGMTVMAREPRANAAFLRLPRPGKASPWNVDDHLVALNNALAPLPEHERGQVLVRADTGACSKLLLGHITDAGLEYSIGFQAHETVKTAIEVIPEQAWRAALDGDGEPRDGAQVAELTAWMPTPVTQNRSSRPGPKDWPAGMRVIARRERPHPAPNCG